MALRYTIGSLVPMVVCMVLGLQHIGLQLMLGVIIVCGADKREPVRKKIPTMLITLLLSYTLSNIVHFVGQTYFVLILFISLFVFLLAYVAPFGNRYASIAFMGNLSIIIALSTLNVYQEPAVIFHHTSLLLAGGIWYCFFAIFISLIATPYQLKKTVGMCMEQTKNYLRQRAKLFDESEEMGSGLLALYERQTELTYIQNDLRDFLFQRISLLRKPASHERRMLHIFVELLEIMEAALATPIDYLRWRKWLVQYPELRRVPEISGLLIEEMEELHRQLFNERRKAPSYIPQLKEYIRQAFVMIKNLGRESAPQEDQKLAYTRALRIIMYQEIQLKKLIDVQWILDNKLEKVATYVDETALHKFANAPELSWTAIKDNFNLRSSQFRFALRTTVTALAGYFLGILLGFQNPYWVLLTILVILKPGYGVSRQRLIHRIIGTVVGAVVAYGLYSLQPSDNISLLIFAAAFFLAFNFVLHVYAVSSLFFTIYVIFLYSFLHREVPSSVLFRVVDTTLGAALCWVALHYLLPSWEYSNFPYYFRKSLAANRALYQHILNALEKGVFEITAYRLARKRVYLDMANVVSSFQRLKSEPLRKQKYAAEYGNLLLLNAAVLSVISSLGIYTSSRPRKKMHTSIRKILTGNAALLDHILAQAGENFAGHLPPQQVATGQTGPQAGNDGSEDEFLLEEAAHLHSLLLRMEAQAARLANGVREQ